MDTNVCNNTIFITKGIDCDIFNKYEPPFKERIDNHNAFYKAETVEKKDCLKFSTYWIHPVATVVILVLLILGIKMISDLIIHHHQTSQDNQLELIITLAPTFLLS